VETAVRDKETLQLNQKKDAVYNWCRRKWQEEIAAAKGEERNKRPGEEAKESPFVHGSGSRKGQRTRGEHPWKKRSQPSFRQGKGRRTGESRTMLFPSWENDRLKNLMKRAKKVIRTYGATVEYLPKKKRREKSTQRGY